MFKELGKKLGKDKKTVTNLAVAIGFGLLLLLVSNIFIGSGSAGIGGASGNASAVRNLGLEQQLEERLSAVFSLVVGAGEVRTMVTMRHDGTGVEGVIILAQGAGDAVVRDALTRAASAVLGVEIHKVVVMRMR
jgi:hypothetical protein